MAAHHISLAKASFGVSLLRPDVTKINRDDLPNFHRAFDAALVQCSRHNIQTCKRWLFENVLVSPARTTALGKFLATISKHLPTQQEETIKSSIPRQRLHILYLLNDLLHHAKYHDAHLSLRDNLLEPLQPFLADLFHLAAFEAKPRVLRRLKDLISIWEEEEYFASDHIRLLKESLAGINSDTQSVPLESRSKSESESERKELPYIIPPTHGDPSLPYYDLPAGNLMRYIVPNSSQPMRSAEIRALQFAGGIADDSLVNALKDFLKDVEGLENATRFGEEGEGLDIDEMGQFSFRDEAGDLVGDTYYGWSRSFCEKMKRRGRHDSGTSSRRSESRSSDDSRNRSNAPHKRQRRNDSANGHSRSSRSYSRSPSRREHRHNRGRWSRSLSRSGSRSRSYSPPDRHSSLPQRPSFEPPKLPSQAPAASPAQAMGLAFLPQSLPPTGFPVPPPHMPPQWAGPWPPPPPPPSSYIPGNQGFPNPPFPPPLPPPPPPGVWPFPPGAPAAGKSGYPGRR